MVDARGTMTSPWRLQVPNTEVTATDEEYSTLVTVHMRTRHHHHIGLEVDLKKGKIEF
jgi:hypothetical protein